MSSEMNASVDGVLLVDKPQGWTSFDVVNYTRRIVAAYVGKKPKNTKVGHTGTLDPLATGLLVLLLGNYTKRAPDLTKLDKTYEVSLMLGSTSSTGDEEGEKKVVSDYRPNEAEIRQALTSFIGEQLQKPPIYSAVKINGQRAYKLARQGKEVQLDPRPVTIYNLQLAAYEYPLVQFTTKVSSGTYIRSLAEDIGATLKTGAYMSDLRRSRVGEFKLEDAVPVQDLDIEIVKKRLVRLP